MNGIKVLIAGLALAVGFALSPAANAATITATPSSGTATVAGQTISVLVEINLGTDPADALQVAIDFSNNESIFTISPNPLTGANGTNLSGGFNQEPNIQTPGENGLVQINTAGFLFGGSVTGTQKLASFDLVATGTVGTLNLVLYAQQSFYSSGGTIQQNISGTIGTYSFAPIPEPSAMILMGAGLAVAGLVGRRALRD